MSYEEISKELSKPNPEIVVREGEKVLSLLELTSMSADRLIDSCKVTIRGDPVSLRKSELRKPFSNKPTGILGLGYNWRGSSCFPSHITASEEVKNLNALDCLKRVYDLSKAYTEGEGWVI